MKMHHIVICFVGIFFIAFLLLMYKNQKVVSYNTTNREYATKLTAACHDAAKTMVQENIMTTGTVWQSKAELEKTLDVFYGTLQRSFDMEVSWNPEQIKEKTPFVLLVDTDGFYISYNACFDEYGNAEVPSSLDSLNVISNLNTWSEKYGEIIVRYYLNEYVQVTSSTNHTYTGTRKKVFDEMSNAGENVGSISFFTDNNTFNNNRTHAIITTIEDIINYYLNTQVSNTSSYSTGYQVTLPEVTKEDWSRMLKNPTVISFLQGEQVTNETTMMNIYAYAAGELSNSYLYYIKDNYYYKLRSDQVHEQTDIVTVNGITHSETKYLYNSDEIDSVYSTMEECVITGALPASY